MKVNYTLPGLLPDASPGPPAESGEQPAELFSSHLQKLRMPDVTDWRAVLRLHIPPAGATVIAPPRPNGIGLRDGESRRAWWRGTLLKHKRLDGTSPEESQMLDLLLETQRREDEIFARYFSEHED